MSSHADILDESERLARPFWVSVLLHLSFAAVVLSYGKLNLGSHVLMGDPHGGGFGSVLVNPVSIPLPAKSGPVNPVANDTESHIPAPPAKAKPQPKPKPLEPDVAIPIKGKNAKRESNRAWSQPNKWQEQQKYADNQIYNDRGAALSSDMYQTRGGGGVGVGTNSPFGQQFGWYASQISDKVGQHWQTGGIDSRQGLPFTVVTFTIQKDGSLAPRSVKITQSSGNWALDLSARHAVEDAAPFNPLPNGFNRSEANVQLRFELRH